MGILAPLALAALPLLAIIVALYLLKLRRPMAPVASLHLWGTLTRDREANSLWQRLKISALLLLQLLALLALILALARPWVPSDEPIGQHAIIVVDVSASMGATDAEERGLKSRLDAAKERARRIVDNLPQDGTATLISSDEHASVLVPASGDKARLREAIDALEPRASSTDMLEAAKLASVMAARQSNSAIWVLSDGAFPAVQDQVERVPGRLNYVQLGRESKNQGITALSLQQRAGSLQLFAQIANAESVSATRRLDLTIDDAPWTARTITLPPGGTQELVIEDVPLDARVVHARLGGSLDRLERDDSAWVVNRASAPGNVLLVTDGNKFLELALSLLPTTTLYKVAPKDYKPSETINGAPLDLTVVDVGVPASLLQSPPAGNLLIFAPQASNPLVQVRGVVSDPVPSAAQQLDSNMAPAEQGTAAEPLLRFVDLTSLHVARAANLEIPKWGRAVLASDKGPLIIAGQEGSRRVAIFAFDVRDTDLPLQTAFPLLLRNIVTYLLPEPAGGLPESVSPGESVGIDAVEPEVDKILVEDPFAKEWTFSVSREQPRIAFAETDEPGVYFVSQYSGEELVAQEAFAVNLFSRDESTITPNQAPGLPAGTTVVGGQPESGGTQGFRREIWPLVALVGFAILLIEWVYAQRIAIRRAITEWQTRRALSHADET